MSSHTSQKHDSTNTSPELNNPTQSTAMNHQANYQAHHQATEDNGKSASQELSSCTPCSPATTAVNPTLTTLVADPQTHTLDRLMAPADSTSAKVVPKSCSLWTQETAIAKTSTMVITTVLCPQYTECNNERKAECANSSVLAMGVMTGLVIVLLMVMAAGYIFIFWRMKRNGREWTIISRQTR